MITTEIMQAIEDIKEFAEVIEIGNFYYIDINDKNYYDADQIGEWYIGFTARYERILGHRFNVGGDIVQLNFSGWDM